MKNAAFLFVVTFIVFVVAANNDSAFLGLLSFAVAVCSALYFIFAALKKIWRAANGTPSPAAPAVQHKDAPCPATGIQITIDHYNGTYFTKIAGVKFRNGKKDIGGFLGYVCAEPDNPYDKNAIAVHRNDGKLVGYIPKDETRALREWSDKENLPCIGYVNVGDYVPLYGRVKIIDDDEIGTNIEIAKFVKWLVENFGTKFVPPGLDITSGTKLRTRADWINFLDNYIDEKENDLYGDGFEPDDHIYTDNAEPNSGSR